MDVERRHPTYLPLDESQLREMYGLHLSLSEMGRRLGVTRDTVRARLVEYTIIEPGQRLPSRQMLRKELDEQRLREMFAQGRNITEMAGEFGVSAGTVRRNLDRLGILSIDQKLRPSIELPEAEELKEIRRKELLSNRKLASRYDVNEGTLASRFRRAYGSTRVPVEVKQEQAKRRAEVRALRVASKKVENLNYVEWEERVRDNEFFGKLGKITYSEDGTEIQCHLCGQFFKWVAPIHVKKHGLDLDGYKELLGLNRRQPLLSPESRLLRRQRARERDSVAAIKGLESPFYPDDPRTRAWRPPRLQRTIGSRDVLNRKRERGELSKGRETKEKNIRRVDKHTGTFSVWSVNYFFAKGAEKVTIEAIGNEIRATGRLKDGSTLTRTYKRLR